LYPPSRKTYWGPSTCSVLSPRADIISILLSKQTPKKANKLCQIKITLYIIIIDIATDIPETFGGTCLSAVKLCLIRFVIINEASCYNCINMEMDEGKYTKRTSSDSTSHHPAGPDTSEQTLDVVIVNEAANAIFVTKEAKMDPAVEEPFLVNDDPNSSGYPSGGSKSIKGINTVVK
jgi:hypothetical protein